MHGAKKTNFHPDFLFFQEENDFEEDPHHFTARDTFFAWPPSLAQIFYIYFRVRKMWEFAREHTQFFNTRLTQLCAHLRVELRTFTGCIKLSQIRRLGGNGFSHKTYLHTRSLAPPSFFSAVQNVSSALIFFLSLPCPGNFSPQIARGGQTKIFPFLPSGSLHGYRSSIGKTKL